MDFMRSVFRGARFDKKRFGKDMDLFKPAALRVSQESDRLRQLAPELLGAPSDEEDDEDSDEDDGKQETVKERLARINALRKKKNIHIHGTDVPEPAAKFKDMVRFGVPAYLLKNLTDPAPEGCGYTNPSPIQMQAVSVMLKDREMLGVAPTGSGKTVAFVLPTLAKLVKPGRSGVRALVLSPTRELAQQIYRQFVKISKGRKFRIFILSKANATANTFGKDASKRKDILVSAPMRLVHIIQQGVIDLSNVEILILDEADRLFDMGFMDQVDTVLAACSNPSLQRALFSATMPQGVETMARTFLRDPVRVTVGARGAAATTVDQKLVFVGQEGGKLIAFRNLVQKGLDLPVLVFVQSKERASQLFKELVYDGLNVDVINSKRTQAQRDTIIQKFRSGDIWVLICTDLMSRGIDFKGVNCVVNYDFPQSTVSYIHRIGRTGRAGRTGTAITFFTESDTDLLRSIAQTMRASGCEVPDWMLTLQKTGRNAKQQLKAIAPARAPISTEWKSPKDKDMDKQRAKKRRKRHGGQADSEGRGKKASEGQGKVTKTTEQKTGKVTKTKEQKTAKVTKTKEQKTVQKPGKPEQKPGKTPGKRKRSRKKQKQSAAVQNGNPT